MTNHEIMLLALVSLKHKAELGIINKIDGICPNLHNIINEIDPNLDYYIISSFKTWKHFKGLIAFPVNGNEEYFDYDDLWDINTNPYAWKRWDLLDHCIRYYADLVSKQNG